MTKAQTHQVINCNCIFGELFGKEYGHNCSTIHKYVKKLGIEETKKRLTLGYSSNEYYSESLCFYSSLGYPHCHCNTCIERIDQYHGFDKKIIYYYENREVKITSFCPFEHCATFFIVDAYNRNGFCKWLSCKEAIRQLKTKLEVKEID